MTLQNVMEEIKKSITELKESNLKFIQNALTGYFQKGKILIQIVIIVFSRQEVVLHVHVCLQWSMFWTSGLPK